MQGKRFPGVPPVRNPLTHQEHRRDVFLQVTLPLVVGILIIGALCVLPVISVSRGGEVRDFADTSLILLIILTSFAALIPLALLGGLAYGITRLYQALPPHLYRLQKQFEKLNRNIKTAADRISQPIIQTHGFFAQTNLIANKFKRFTPGQKGNHKEQKL